MSAERAEAIGRFLDSAGWRGAGVQPLAGDASFRRYLRVRRNGCGAMLMDAPPAHEDVRPFLAVARHLHALGLSAPGILATDEQEGFLLLEDFGDDTFTRLLAAGTDEATLYRMAVDVLVYLHRLPVGTALPDRLPRYDTDRLLAEVLLLTDWYAPAVLAAPLAGELRDAYAEAWRAVLEPVAAEPATLVLRDFHVDNLMRLAARDGLAACGLLDFQDAVAGPPAYDLMSLLEDARRDVSPQVKQEMLERYCAARGELDRAAFHRTFTVLAAQRHAKVIAAACR